jgi:hypothetical protein
VPSTSCRRITRPTVSSQRCAGVAEHEVSAANHYNATQLRQSASLMFMAWQQPFLPPINRMDLTEPLLG